MEAISEDLIEEVLIKLPCKSLIRFKRVSTKWHNLISRQSFAISQVQTFKDPNALFFVYDTNPRPRGNIIITPICVSRAPQQFVISVNPNMKVELPPTMADYDSRPISLKMLPLGLGIYCVFDLRTFTEFLWNPTTGQTQLLPKSPYSKLCQYHSHHFGRVYFEDGKFHYQVGRFDVSRHYALDLYSSKTGSWNYTTQVFSDCRYVDSSQCSVNLNGRAHFLISPSGKDNYIASFNYETGMFSRIRVPFAANAGHFEKTYGILTLYDEKFICLILTRRMNLDGQCLDIWVMCDYHDEDSWVKQFTVGSLPKYMKVMGFSSKLQGIVMQSFSRLVLCDCKSSAVIECDSIINFSRGESYVVEQVESLVSMS